MAESLLEALPDLIVLVQREGTVISCAGGGGVGHLKPAAPEGQRLESLWPAPMAEVIKQLVRKAIATRAPTEARFEDEGRSFEARVSAQGPQRALCVIRPTLTAPREDSLDLTGERPRPQLDRRGFLKRFKERTRRQCAGRSTGCASSVAALRWMISEPVTPRWPTSRAFRPTASK
jgi:hypothetical protein